MPIETVSSLALAGGAAWASGLNLYAALLVLGVLGSTGTLELPSDLQVLSHPLVMVAAGFMYCVEFFVDKTPGADSAWDALHTFIRIPAGAVLAATAIGDVDPAIKMAAFIVGGGLAAATHAAKAGTRAVINTSPEPVTNWTASLGEDAMVIAGLWTALHHPLVFLALLALFVVLLVWFLPRLWRVLCGIARRLREFFRGADPGGTPGQSSSPLSLEDHRG